MIVSILLGYFLGAPLAFLISRRLLATIAARLGRDESGRRFIRNAGTVLGAIALAPALFGGVLVAGYLTQPGAGAPGPASMITLADLALGLGLCLGIIGIVVGAAAAGAWLGALTMKSSGVPR
ncbi:MAG: hypothetical protein IT494_02590 [Gammaproteobacteria bacterium]|nr:hypothetical protein [Gammaproteobacteria bacterium]